MLSGAKQSSFLGDLHPDVLQVLLGYVPVLAVQVLSPLDVLRRKIVDQFIISGTQPVARIERLRTQLTWSLTL